MGAECSVDKNTLKEMKNEGQYDGKVDSPSFNSTNIFEFRNYKEYHNKMENFKAKLKEILGKHELINPFKLRRNNLLDRIENSVHSRIDEMRIEKLVEVAIFVYQKIGTVFGAQSFPKQELAKVNYNMIACYLSYRYKEDDDSAIITQKIIKRINFFSEEFPFKLSKLYRTISSQKILLFAYDIHHRLNFYIRPNLPTYSIENKDYVIFIFFIIEHVLPVLQSKYNFSTQVNITLDFNGEDADTELIRFIIHYFDNFYPLALGKLNVINFAYENLRKNVCFREELDDLNFFRNIVFYERSYKFQLIKETYPNCLPIEYGGYHSMDSYKIKPDFVLEDFIEYIISMILVKCI